MRRDESKPRPLSATEYLREREEILLDVEVLLGDSPDPRAQAIAQRAHFIAERRPRGT